MPDPKGTIVELYEEITSSERHNQEYTKQLHSRFLLLSSTLSQICQNGSSNITSTQNPELAENSL